jgi:hypothetical protein
VQPQRNTTKMIPECVFSTISYIVLKKWIFKEVPISDIEKVTIIYRKVIKRYRLRHRRKLNKCFSMIQRLLNDFREILFKDQCLTMVVNFQILLAHLKSGLKMVQVKKYHQQANWASLIARHQNSRIFRKCQTISNYHRKQRKTKIC